MSRKSRSKNQQRYVLAVILLFAIAIIWYANLGKKISPVRESAVAPETIGGFGLAGRGGDPLLNKQKNRYTMPLDVHDMTVSNIIQIPSNVLSDAGRTKRERWVSSAVDYVREQESRGIRVMGYLVNVKEEGRESCNGYSDSLHDYHIWISEAPSYDKSNALIVEMTPRWQAVRPDWNIHEIQRLTRQHAHVRVTGWLMWDEEHADEVGKSRGTQWELHPVTAFEVFEDGAWHPI